MEESTQMRKFEQVHSGHMGILLFLNRQTDMTENITFPLPRLCVETTHVNLLILCHFATQLSSGLIRDTILQW